MASSRRICKSAPMEKSDSVVEALEELRRERARYFRARYFDEFPLLPES
jgi:hypothetical protein